MPRWPKKTEEFVGDASEVPEGTITKTRSDRQSGQTYGAKKPDSSKYVVRHIFNNQGESIKVVKLDTYNGWRTTSRLALRANKVKGRWTVKVGKMNAEIRAALNEQGFKGFTSA